jgi:hypothetical protein
VKYADANVREITIAAAKTGPEYDSDTVHELRMIVENMIVNQFVISG